VWSALFYLPHVRDLWLSNSSLLPSQITPPPRAHLNLGVSKAVWGGDIFIVFPLGAHVPAQRRPTTSEGVVGRCLCGDSRQAVGHEPTMQLLPRVLQEFIQQLEVSLGKRGTSNKRAGKVGNVARLAPGIQPHALECVLTWQFGRLQRDLAPYSTVLTRGVRRADRILPIRYGLRTA